MINESQLIITECSKCNKIIWPRCNFCDLCLGKTNKRKIKNIGKIIEFSKKNKIIFCVGEFEKIRVIGTLNSKSNRIFLNSKIKLHVTKKSNSQYSYLFTLIKT